jgi:hypothetical protein
MFKHNIIRVTNSRPEQAKPINSPLVNTMSSQTAPVVKKTAKFEKIEIDSLLLGVSTTMCPLAEHNMATRITYMGPFDPYDGHHLHTLFYAGTRMGAGGLEMQPERQPVQTSQSQPLLLKKE